MSTCISPATRTPSPLIAPTLDLSSVVADFASLFCRFTSLLFAFYFRHLSYFDAVCAAVEQAKRSVWMETCVARPFASKRHLCTE